MNVLSKILLLGALVGCGASTADFVRPAFIGTSEACYQLQARAVDKAETREEAEAAVEDIRRRCDIAYDGIRVAGELTEELRGENDE